MIFDDENADPEGPVAALTYVTAREGSAFCSFATGRRAMFHECSPHALKQLPLGAVWELRLLKMAMTDAEFFSSNTRTDGKALADASGGGVFGGNAGGQKKRKKLLASSIVLYLTISLYDEPTPSSIRTPPRSRSPLQPAP